MRLVTLTTASNQILYYVCPSLDESAQRFVPSADLTQEEIAAVAAFIAKLRAERNSDR